MVSGWHKECVMPDYNANMNVFFSTKIHLFHRLVLSAVIERTSRSITEHHVGESCSILPGTHSPSPQPPPGQIPLPYK